MNIDNIRALTVALGIATLPESDPLTREEVANVRLAMVGLLDEVDRLRAEVARLKSRAEAAEAESVAVWTEAAKSAAIVRRPIETLPKKRDQPVLLWREWIGLEATVFPKDDRRVPSRALGWTHWSPLPPLAEEDAPTEPDLSDLLVPGWEMPKAPEEGAVCVAFRWPEIDRWVVEWRVSVGGPRLKNQGSLKFPVFHREVTVTADMLRALGFTVEGE